MTSTLYEEMKRLRNDAVNMSVKDLLMEFDCAMNEVAHHGI